MRVNFPQASSHEELIPAPTTHSKISSKRYTFTKLDHHRHHHHHHHRHQDAPEVFVNPPPTGEFSVFFMQEHPIK